jgi:diguanylate cyclase (GGDEF)-like protein
MLNRMMGALRRFVLPGGAMALLTALLCWLRVPNTVAEPAWQAVLVAATLAVIVLAGRFHLYRVALAGVILGLTAFAALSPLPVGAVAHPCFQLLLRTVVPVNLLLLLLIQETSFDGESLSWWAGLVGLQAAILMLAVHGAGAAILAWMQSPLFPVAPWARAWAMPDAVVTTLALIALGALTGCRRRPSDTGIFWASLAICVALRLSTGNLLVFHLCAALALGAGVLEAAYAVAFHDELTGLPSRRAYNRQMSTLGGEYSIAAVDIDFFKKFNDTYGHDVGDEVLRMVAGKLAEVTGGGRAFRCGGEEFSVIFPHLGTQDSYEHVELLRQTIASSSFAVRGTDRSRRKRPERRYFTRAPKEREQGGTAVVTVSIGLAEPSREATSEEVAKWADQALYCSKEAGRNQVTIYSAKRLSRKSAVDAPTEKEPFR